MKKDQFPEQASASVVAVFIHELQQKALCVPKCHQHVPPLPDFLSSLVIGDETWVHHFTTTSKIESLREITLHLKQKKLFRTWQPARKVYFMRCHLAL
jgi:hypothetical protein